MINIIKRGRVSVADILISLLQQYITLLSSPEPIKLLTNVPVVIANEFITIYGTAEMLLIIFETANEVEPKCSMARKNKNLVTLKFLLILKFRQVLQLT